MSAALAPHRVVGVLSGTSADAIDVAVADLTLTDDTVMLARVGHRSIPFAGDLRARILAVLPPASTTTQDICRLDADLGRAFAAAASLGIAELGGGGADLVVVLGQTVHHDVADGSGLGSTSGEGPGVGSVGTVRGTLQLGQPAEVAEATGVPVVADLRSRDVAAGGQGAPLTSFLDVLLLAEAASVGPVATCNLGGIANLTVVADGQPPIAFDCGPANALLDVAARTTIGAPFDADGALAATGTVDAHLLDVLLADPFLAADAPKSTGKERYHAGYLRQALARAPAVTAPDLLATLAEAVAVAIAEHAARAGVARLWASGGGIHNRQLVARLKHHLAACGTAFATTDELGLPVDAKEAYGVALLGWCTWMGIPATVPSCTGAAGPRVLGSVTPGRGPLTPPPPTHVRPTRLQIEPAAVGASVAERGEAG